MPYLIVHTPNFPPQRIALREAIIAGRAVGCEIWIEDALVSRHHCRFERRGDEWIVTDLESRNGTIVDGQPITEAVLADSSTVRIGASEIVFHADRVSDRPANPIESAESEASILNRESASDNSTILGQTLAGAAPPDERPSRSVDEARAVSLPFRRQPPKPIVYEMPDEDAPAD